MKKQTLATALAISALLSLQRPVGGDRATAGLRPPATPSPQVRRLDTDFGKLPICFIPNRGQLAGPAAFYVQGTDKTIYFAADGLTFALSGPPGSAAARWVVKMDFVGADPDATPVSLEGSGTVFSFFKGKPEEWRSGIPGSSKIVYRELWPGIDLAYYGTVGRMKYEFIVRPGVDPARIRLAYRGAPRVTVTEEGRLAVTTPAGSFEDDVPAAWQEIEGGRSAVPATYFLEAVDCGPRDGTQAFGFRVGPYDKSRTLVIDPAVLVYCGYIGGSVWEEGKAIAVDTSGNSYVTGYTGSSASDFPVTVGPDLTYNGDPYDTFVAKVNADGTGLLYCGYLGGSGYDEPGGIAVDGSGNAYIAGLTTSPDFPVTAGSTLTYAGDRDAFVVKIDATGSALVYSGCIGGSGEDNATAIAVDGSGHAFVTGETFSDDLPAVVGPDLTSNGMQDAYVAKVNEAGTALDYCGYIGGPENQEGRGIAVDSAGSAYVTGNTGPGFPVKVGPGLTWSGGYDAFVAKVHADGTELVYSGYLGGEFEEFGHGIAVDSTGHAYVTGFTDSPQDSFPVTVGPGLTRNEGSADAFVAKLSADGATLVYCGLIGGGPNSFRPGNDYGTGIAVDGAGNAYIVGQTDSDEGTFPVANGPGLTWNGLNDIFIAKVNATGTGLVYCGYIGGAEEDEGRGVAVDSAGNAYITGWAASPEGTFPVLAGPDLTYNSGWDAFVAKVSAYDVPAPLLTSLDPASVQGGGSALTLSVHGDDFEDGAVVRWNGSGRPTTYISGQELRAEIGATDLEARRIVWITVRNPNGGVSNAQSFLVDDPPNPLPVLTSLSPAQATIGDSGFALTLMGSNFLPGSTVLWSGQSRATTYVSGTELTAAIATTDLATAGRYRVTVANPEPGGGTSSAIDFAVVTFSIDVSRASATVTAGQTANFTVQVTPQFGAFDHAVSLSCTGLPKDCTAAFTPGSVTPGANSASCLMTLKSTARKTASEAGTLAASARLPPALGLLVLISAFALLSIFSRQVSVKRLRPWATAAVLICLIKLMVGCSAGGGSGPTGKGTPAGTYQITVQGASGNLKASTVVTLIVR